MEESKKKFIETIKQGTSILVTVRSNPTIDHLAACIALSLMLNEMGKHATAVFSGNVPEVLDFLEPEKTLKTDTDSLQDFIISLDKVKADKLRYKVEDDVVKIFITPYKTSISSKDLEFSQGDFNVDVIVALGVHLQEDLDKAVIAHGRILHDATVVSLNVTTADESHEAGKEELGSINWVDTTVSSLSEMLADSIEGLQEGEPSDKHILDNQVATALLTGIVAETDRFGNSKTTPATMQTSAMLLTAGANQELVATKLSGANAGQHVSTGSISLETPDEGDMVGYGEDAAADSAAADDGNAQGDAEKDSDAENEGAEDDSDGSSSKSSHRRSKKKKHGHHEVTPVADGSDPTSANSNDSSGPSGASDTPADQPGPIADASVAIEHGDESGSVNEGESSGSEGDTSDGLKMDGLESLGELGNLDKLAEAVSSDEQKQAEVGITGVRSDNVSAQQSPGLSPLDLSGGVSAADPDGVVTGDGVLSQPQVYDLNQISVPASITLPGAAADVPADKPAEAAAADAPAPAESAVSAPPAASTTPDNPTPLTGVSWPAVPTAPAAGETPAEAASEAAKSESEEDQAVMNVLSNSKAINTERTTIQPLRDQNGFVDQPPLQDKKTNAAGAGGSHAPVDSTLDPIKFALTPPTLGGTLTAGHDLSNETPSPDPMTGDLVRTRAIMTHDPQTMAAGSAAAGQDPASQGLEAKDSGEPRGVGELDPNAEPEEHNGLPQFGLIHADKPADAGAEPAKAVPPTKKHVIEPLSSATNEAGMAGSANTGPNGGLSALLNLEQQLNNAAPAATPVSSFNPAAGNAGAGPIQADSVDQALQAALVSPAGAGFGAAPGNTAQPAAGAVPPAAPPPMMPVAR